jgi:N-acetylglucosaminyldiphosphoundecaprenol N-acetyl-beta-D-mannosaminyltransferase
VKLDLLGVRTDAQPFDQAISSLAAWANEADGRRYVCTCPVYTLMMCREQPAVMEAVNEADMVTADGMPIVWLQRRLGVASAERVYGPDIMLALCEATAGTGIRHYLWGGQEGVGETLVKILRARYPSLAIDGYFAPPVREVSDAPDSDAVDRLNAGDAQIIWVGLGSPKQDLWMAKHRPLLNAPLLIGVGAAFDMLAGVKKQAPRWMQRIGLEWLFRLMQEPRRLAKRYLIYNPKFMWSVIREYHAAL